MSTEQGLHLHTCGGAQHSIEAPLLLVRSAFSRTANRSETRISMGHQYYARVLAVLSSKTGQVAYLRVRWYESFADDAARRQNAVRGKRQKQRRVLRAGINKFDNPTAPGLPCMQWQMGTPARPASTDIVDARHVSTVAWVVQNTHDELWWHCTEPNQIVHQATDQCEGLQW